jgi:membrane protein required for colicin V production
MPALLPIDLLATVIVAAAALRGLFNGLIREVFSVLALVGAVMAVRVWNPIVAERVGEAFNESLGPAVVPWVSGTLIAVGVVIAVGTFGAVMGRGARAVGLGMADRMAGAALGIAEGAIVVGVILTLAGSLLGRNHPSLAYSQSFALLQMAQRATSEAVGAPVVDVAAPPPES